MNKKIIEKLKEKLEQEKENLEKELKGFADKDKNIPGNWNSRFVQMVRENIEDSADEVEEYGNMLPVEHILELKLKDINTALEKIKNGSYGKCENCNKDIPIERLEITPSAKKCLKCK